MLTAATALSSRSVCAGSPRANRPHRRCAVAARADGRDVGSPAEPQGGAGGLPGSAGGASATGGGTVELKGGALWWQHVRSSTGGGTAELKYGSNFVLQRPGSVGGAGLVRAVRPPKPVRRSPPTPPLPPVVWRAPGAAAGGAGLVLSGSSLASGSVVIDTECFVLPTPGQQQAQQQQQQLLPGAIPPNTTCVGIVWQPSADPQAEAAAQPPARRGRSSKHPRRTQMLRFTCNLCGETNDCAINPHAWEAGSVFARCEGCTAVHKLKDNLKIFTELVSVFPPRELCDNYLVQETLDKIQENNRN